jgi:hypothetical protein
MTTWLVSRVRRAALGIALLAVNANTVPAQVSPAQTRDSGTVLGQLSAAFSGGQVVQSVQLTGTATWHSGSLEDSGTVTLTASADGSSQMHLELASMGERTESQAGSGLRASCQWAGADGVTHAVQATNCWRPAVWFLPAISLQPSLLPVYLGAVDLGMGTVGSSADTYRHLQTQLAFSGLPSSISTRVTQHSITDLGLDPTTLLPAVLSYTVQPDSGAQTSVAIHVLYSDYRAVNGVRIPFHIQRYLSGSLQLDIVINSAQIN